MLVVHSIASNLVYHKWENKVFFIWFFSLNFFFMLTLLGGGLVINVSSIAALRGLPLAGNFIFFDLWFFTHFLFILPIFYFISFLIHPGTAYCASKAAMNLMGSTISAEQYAHNIRVCNFCPGEVNTPIIDQRAVIPCQGISLFK